MDYPINKDVLDATYNPYFSECINSIYDGTGNGLRYVSMPEIKEEALRLRFLDPTLTHASSIDKAMKLLTGAKNAEEYKKAIKNTIKENELGIIDGFTARFECQTPRVGFDKLIDTMMDYKLDDRKWENYQPKKWLKEALKHQERFSQSLMFKQDEVSAKMEALFEEFPVYLEESERSDSDNFCLWLLEVAEKAKEAKSPFHSDASFEEDLLRIARLLKVRKKIEEHVISALKQLIGADIIDSGCHADSIYKLYRAYRKELLGIHIEDFDTFLYYGVWEEPENFLNRIESKYDQVNFKIEADDKLYVWTKLEKFQNFGAIGLNTYNMSTIMALGKRDGGFEAVGILDGEYIVPLRFDKDEDTYYLSSDLSICDYIGDEAYEAIKQRLMKAFNYSGDMAQFLTDEEINRGYSEFGDNTGAIVQLSGFLYDKRLPRDFLWQMLKLLSGNVGESGFNKNGAVGMIDVYDSEESYHIYPPIVSPVVYLANAEELAGKTQCTTSSGVERTQMVLNLMSKNQLKPLLAYRERQNIRT